MKFISWNINGLRSIIKKNFYYIFNKFNSDFFCLQEIKLQKNQLNIILPNYYKFFNYAINKKGYSGTAIFAKKKPIKYFYNLNINRHNKEGRVITLEYPNFFLINCYTPNSQIKLKRLKYRIDWDLCFQNFLNNLKKIKPIILCGDFNVAHKIIDIKNWKTNQNNAGFTKIERILFTKLLNYGFIDTFRLLNPDKKNAYTWWSYKFNSRFNNIGWRIDYFIISNNLKNNLISSKIHKNIYGSDHCPIEINLKF